MVTSEFDDQWYTTIVKSAICHRAPTCAMRAYGAGSEIAKVSVDHDDSQRYPVGLRDDPVHGESHGITGHTVLRLCRYNRITTGLDNIAS
jgi:hypothetical protein